ncbi:MAG: vanadium-dependent haloperoxidase [Acidobacteriota bacterium]
MTTLSTQNPFAQARFMAITQLAVFEAVNAVTQKYEPYLGLVVAPGGARADAAAVAAAYRVLKTYVPSAATLDAAYAASLAGIPDGQGKIRGIATGEAAAALMIAQRLNDGSAPPESWLPASIEPGVWQLTPGCPLTGGQFLHWQHVTPFGVPTVLRGQSWLERFRPEPPPALGSRAYAKDYNEVMRVGNLTSDATNRPVDRANVARFFALSSPSFVFNLVTRQVAAAQGRSLTHNARTLALINMASSDAMVATVAAKYHYNLWRPITAIAAADTDGNPRTEPDVTFRPFIGTPCFPSYPSNHASASGAAAELLERIYGASGHRVGLENPAVPGIVLQYRSFRKIIADVDDARVYGGIHFRFDQEAGGRLAQQIASYIYRHNLRRADRFDGPHQHDADCDDDDQDDRDRGGRR